MNEHKKLKVGVHSFEPVVFQRGGAWTGFEVDLWRKIAENIDVEYEFTENKTLPDLLTQTSAEAYDIGMAGITRTTDRAEKLHMSFFTLDTGLGIATLPTHTFSIKDLLRGLFSKQTMMLLGILVVFSVVIAHVYWLVEAGESVSEHYALGVFEALWWSIVTFSTVGYGDISPATGIGQAFGMVAILSGLAIFGLYIGQLSASLTLTKMKSKIASADDLADKKIAVKKGTTAEDVVAEKQGKVVAFEKLEEAYSALKNHSVDAIVADMPVLQNVEKQQGFVLVGGAFARQAYAFVLPKTEEHKELLAKIDTSLIGLRESGEYDELYDKYFK